MKNRPAMFVLLSALLLLPGCTMWREHPGSNKAFSNSLEERGYKRKHTRDGSMFYGIALTPPEMTEEEAAARWWTGW